jgi:hypothetical protein
MPIANPRVYVLLLIFLICNNSFAAKEQPISVSIAISEQNLVVFNTWIAHKNCWDVDKFPADHSNRAAVELVMLCKALQLGGLEFTLDIYHAPNYGRSLLLGKQKKVHLLGESIWKDQADYEHFYVSPPLLKKGEFQKGIYTLKTHPMMKLVHNVDDLINYRGISINSWHHDWDILRHLTKNMFAAPSKSSIHKMIKHDRADFTLGEFNHDMSILMGGVYLYPIPNLKVVVDQSRHFVVRKGMKNSEKIISAFNKGLLEMLAQGTIKRMYMQTGFISSKAENWEILKPVLLDKQSVRSKPETGFFKLKT